MSVPDLFLLIAGVIFLGWLGQVFFDRTRVPDVLLLIGMGVLLGPVLGVLPAAPLRTLAPHFGTLALIIILFEGGLKLNLREILFQFGPASALTLLNFTLGSAALAALAHAFLGWDWAPSYLFGAILSGAPSGVIALPVVQRMRLPEAARTVVSLEASLSDIFAILAVVITLGVLEPLPGSGSSVAGALLSTFLLAGLTALLVGLAWLAVLNLVRGHPLSYMLTLGVLFLSYALTEKLGGSGALAVLLTGAVVANAGNVFKVLERRWHHAAAEIGIPPGTRAMALLEIGRYFAPVEESLLRFNGEIAFIVRTFFFVFLGAVAQAPTSSADWAILGAAFVTAFLARAVGVGAFVGLFSGHRPQFLTYLVMAPRGLAAAVLAYLPAAHGVAGAEALPQVAFGFIILSNLLLTLGVPLVETRSAPEPTS